MIEVKIPAEIREYKGKLMFGLTVRQIIAIVAALAVGVPLGVFGADVIPNDYLLWIVMLSVSPIFLWGFVPYKGMKFEEYVRVLYNFYVLPQKRVYEDVDVNYLCYVNEVLRAREICKQRIEKGEIEDDEKLQEEEDSYVFN